MSVSVYNADFRIIMVADHLVWLARPSCKRPEARKGTDYLQKTRKCRFNSFGMVVAVVDCIQVVFWRNLSFRSYLNLESVLITQTAQNCGRTN